MHPTTRTVSMFSAFGGPAPCRLRGAPHHYRAAISLEAAAPRWRSSNASREALVLEIWPSEGVARCLMHAMGRGRNPPQPRGSGAAYTPTMKIGPGFTFSWRRALGVTKAKRRIARATGIPTTRQGRRAKVGRWFRVK